MTLVERACDVDSEEDDDEAAQRRQNGNGPYGTVLHTACAIGIKWIVEMQIKARVDVTALDDHCWTALMVAEVQGHANCARILSDYLEEIGANMTANPLPPTELVRSEPNAPVYIDGEYFKALPNLWYHELLRKRVHVRADHPIPPQQEAFYFEMSIISNGPNGHVIPLATCSHILTIFPVSWQLGCVDRRLTSSACLAGTRIRGDITEMME